MHEGTLPQHQSAPAAASGGTGETLPIVLSSAALLVAVCGAAVAMNARGRARRSPQPGV